MLPLLIPQLNLSLATAGTLAMCFQLANSVSQLGFGALATVPVFTALAAFVILRRAGNFALTNPGMEVLFTVVPREDKYKAKSFIETFVYRGGDQLGIRLGFRADLSKPR